MGFPAYLFTNEIDSSASITSSSEDSLFVHENLFDGILAFPFQWTEDISGGGTVWLEIDFGAGILADTIAILNHNFTSSAIFSLKSGNSASPGSELVVPSYREFEIWKAFTDPSHRYYRLEITDTNPDLPYIGQLVIGVRTTLTSRLSYGWQKGIDHARISHETFQGVSYDYDLYDRREFEWLFRSIQDSHLTELNTLDGLVRGRSNPVVIIENESTEDVYYVKAENFYSVRSIRFNESDVTIRWKEESRGGAVTL